MKQYGIYRISYELLEQFLELDDDHKIVDVFSSHQERKHCVIGAKVSGPCMPKNPEGVPGVWVPLDHIQHMKEVECEGGKKKIEKASRWSIEEAG